MLHNWRPKLFEKKGLAFDTASSGKEALEKAQQKKYDFILMDVGLEEGTDGIMVAEQIQRNGLNKVTPIIFLSANSANTYQDRLDEIVFLQYVLKPLTRDKIEEIVRIIEEKK